jgi:hypothetical protein
VKKLLIGALIAGSLVSFEAKAQYRATDAALGAVSGALVLGPVGAAAGALIGYTSGPAIANSWGLRRSASRSRDRHLRQSSVVPQEHVADRATSAPLARTPRLQAGKQAPPVQGFD